MKSFEIASEISEIEIIAVGSAIHEIAIPAKCARKSAA
jgi:hypothetical protein